ncbi:OPT family oligopeptide transporter, partial [Pseudomonas aeruginosa]
MQERIPDELTLPELTLRGLILGALITVVFTASNVYLGLKVGLTFASSIPAAVISMAVLRYFSGANILENNMVQTQASAAGTLSSIIFILPGLLMIGYWSGFPFWQTAAICSIGGILGVLYTIPLRRVMVVQSELPYPEGVAAAEILRVGSDGAEDEEDARAPRAAGNAPGLYDILGGGLVAALFSLWSSGFKVLAEGFSVWLSAGQAAFRLSTGFSLALVGAGYLMGITAGIAILIGVVISWGVAVPLLTVNSVPADGQSLSDLATQLWSSQVRFLGAGTIGVAALWTLATLFKPMVRGVWASLGAVRGNSQANSLRTELDMPAKWILLIAGILLVSLFVVFSHFLGAAAPDMASPQFWSLVAVCVVFAFFFGFLIAAACGYMAGLVGSSSSPISGIGIIAVILVSLLILGFGSIEGGLLDRQNGKLAIALALFTTSVVLAIAAISNDNLQDLKTGYLVGATPWRQQVALIVGCIVGALVIPPVLELLYSAYGFTGALPREGMDPG